MYLFRKLKNLLFVFVLLNSFSLQSCTINESKNEQNIKIDVVAEKDSTENKAQLKLGAARIEAYIDLLKNKKIGFVGNHSSMIGFTNVVDTLLSLGLEIVKIYSPEHGFRGTADAGEKVSSSVDEKTKLPIYSLYGDNKKPSVEMLKGVDLMIFDIQDVGARFYTYISTLHYVMEACAEQNIPLFVFDRPNPNGYYIDGPILEEKFQSFVGMHPVPVVHGMTIGEYAKMINGEKWLKNKQQANLQVIRMENYTHSYQYVLPQAPSPNLPNMDAVYLYPSLCFFEGTPVSVGRGTDKPFQQFGHPSFKTYSYVFTPQPMFGAKNPKLKGENCYGKLLTDAAKELKDNGQINLEWLIDSYQQYALKEKFFSNFFNLLAGNNSLQEQIKAGKSANEIRESWKSGLDKFQSEVRIKYLLYEDF